MRTCTALLTLAVAAALPAQAETRAPAAAEETYIRVAHAARRSGEITLDGRMDEPAWQAAPLEDSFTQAQPDEGQPASVHTAFRVLWDDEYLYFGAICDDPLPPTATLTRRDRSTEGDSVQFDLDTTFDRRTAYHFQVYAAGQQLDALHYNDTSFTTDWDAAWDSAVARTPTGWSVEMRIPLRVMRIPEHATRMGFNVYRILSRRKEEDQWRFRPAGRSGDISRLGVLEGIEGIHPVRSMELRPYVAGRLIRTSPSDSSRVPHSEPGLCTSTGIDVLHVGEGCVGLDLRYNLASDLALVGTVNPDFGQVEADQRVLNLSTFETFFPEKRPFFLEGLDLFKPAVKVDFGGPYGGDAYQIFYSRRIGRATPSLDLNDDQTLVYKRPFVPVLAAAKISGTVGGNSVGLLTALEPRVDEQVLQPDGHVEDIRAAEARSTSALRVQRNLGDHGLVGFTGTAVDPFATDSDFGLVRRHAHVVESDLSLYTSDRSALMTIQSAGSLLTGNQPDTLRDGTQVGNTAAGGAVSLRLQYEKEYWLAILNSDYLSPKFTVNDLGFMRRANLFRVVGGAAIRNPHPTDTFQRTQVISLVREVRDARFDRLLERDAVVETSLTFRNFWFLNAGVFYQFPYVDDRELDDGTAIERQAAWTQYGYMETDPRKRVQLQLYWNYGRATQRYFERGVDVGTNLIFRPLPQLDGELDLEYTENAGTFRKIRAATALPGTGEDPTVELDPGDATRRTRLYLLANQHSRALSATWRMTYAFTPHVTLQGYAQFFTAGIAYGAPLQTIADAGKPTISLQSLRPADPATLPPDDVDDRQAGINVNLIFRWEWRTGSTIYFVYAHQTTNDVTPPRGLGLQLRRELGTAFDAGATHGDTLLFKMDFLTAL